MLLGLDLGTTNVKAIVTQLDGSVVASGSAPIGITHFPDGRVEQDIDDIWSAVLAAISQANRSCDCSKVRAIGVSSQGAAMQIQTPDGRPIGPVISWLDSRGRPHDRGLPRYKQKPDVVAGPHLFRERQGRDHEHLVYD